MVFAFYHPSTVSTGLDPHFPNCKAERYLATVELRLFHASVFLPMRSCYLERFCLHDLEKSYTPLKSQLHGHLRECLFFSSQADIICPLPCIPNSLNTFSFFETQFISWATKSLTSSAIPYSFFLHPVCHDVSPK